MSLWLQLEEDYGFFEWLDPPTSKWIKDLLLDLKDTVFRLKREMGEAVVDEARERHFEEVELINQCLQRQLLNMDAQLEAKDKELVKKEEELEAMQKQLDALEVKMKGMKSNVSSSCCVIMFVFVLGLLVAIVMNGSSK